MRDVEAGLAKCRELVERITERGEVNMGPALADWFRLLDEHLTAGGKPPEEWVEGSDAPEMDGGGGRFPYPHPDGGGVTVVGEDGVGLIAESDGFRYYLTPCCLASAKGSVNSSTGVACRRCYAEVDAELGGVPGVSGPAVFWVTLPEPTA
jgi:hypothetical protein